MSYRKRIGALLVEEGLITRLQLERALQSQLMAGGHLGTSLIEHGFIDEDGLAEVLGRALNMRHATRAAMTDLPADVLELLDAQTVERFRVIPLGRGFRSLHVAMITPRDVSSLSARTAYRIIPWIAPELTVLEAMERCYGIPLPRRFLVLSGKARRPEKTSVTSSPPLLSPLEEAALHAAVPSAVAGGPAVASGQPARADLPGADITPAPVAALDVTASQAASGRPAMPCWSFEDVSGLLSHADSREELAAVVLDYAIQHMPACILFGVREDSVYVWDWRGLDLAPGRVSGLEFPVSRGSVFQLLRGEPVYQGPVPPQPQCEAFFDALERPVPEEILLLPVYLEGRLIAVLYGEGSHERPITADLEDYLHLVSKISMALNIIILKMKIRVG